MIDIIDSQCAWCLKVRINSFWYKGPNFKLQDISHGICPDCLEGMRRELEEKKKEKKR